MKYVVSDQYAGGAGWTADKLAEALKLPLADIGVTVERIAGHIEGGFKAEGMPPQAYKEKFDAVGSVVRAVLREPPPA
jgi:hypothetical protein